MKIFVFIVKNKNEQNLWALWVWYKSIVYFSQQQTYFLCASTSWKYIFLHYGVIVISFLFFLVKTVISFGKNCNFFWKRWQSHFCFPVLQAYHISDDGKATFGREPRHNKACVSLVLGARVVTYYCDIEVKQNEDNSQKFSISNTFFYKGRTKRINTNFAITENGNSIARSKSILHIR